MSSGEGDAVREEVFRLQEAVGLTQKELPKIHYFNTNPTCIDCEGPTQRAGACYVCVQCGSTTGCS